MPLTVPSAAVSDVVSRAVAMIAKIVFALFAMLAAAQALVAPAPIKSRVSRSAIRMDGKGEREAST